MIAAELLALPDDYAEVLAALKDQVRTASAEVGSN